MGISTDQIVAQSLTAIDQHREKWKNHCRHNSRFKMKSFEDFHNTGIGKAVLAIANGYSFELEIETIKKHQDKVDILVCDKTLGHCLKNGITPTYCVVADASVNYEKYMEPWKDQLQNTIIFQNVCGNPQWVDNGNWKDRYFFICQDAVNSEAYFSELSGCKNFIAAGTNVSNAMVIFLTQCNNSITQNFFGYDKILLIGFDYSWEHEGNYYAFDHDGSGKFYYMRHIYGRNMAGKYCYTSNNLSFSAQWLKKYVEAFNLPVVQCSKHSVFTTKVGANLEEQMCYSYKKEDLFTMKNLYQKKSELMSELGRIELGIKSIYRDHKFAFLGSV